MIFLHTHRLPTQKTSLLLSSPIQTILSVLESHQILRRNARGLYRRSGISPCPEEYHIYLLPYYNMKKNEFQGLFSIFDNGNFSKKQYSFCESPTLATASTQKRRAAHGKATTIFIIILLFYKFYKRYPARIYIPVPGTVFNIYLLHKYLACIFNPGIAIECYNAACAIPFL